MVQGRCCQLHGGIWIDPSGRTAKLVFGSEGNLRILKGVGLSQLTGERLGKEANIYRKHGSREQPESLGTADFGVTKLCHTWESILAFLHRPCKPPGNATDRTTIIVTLSGKQNPLPPAVRDRVEATVSPEECLGLEPGQALYAPCR